MSDGPNQSQWNVQNITIIVLLGVVVVLLAANLFKKPAPVARSAAPAFDRAAARRDRGANDGRREEDPYIANQVKNTIIKQYPDIQQCYNKFLEDKPEKTDGRVTIDWQIELDGEVSNPELVTSDFANEVLTSCLIEKIKDFKFPPPPYGTPEYVAHKFMFKKQDENQENK